MEGTVCEDGEVNVGRIELVGKTAGGSVPAASVGVIEKVGVMIIGFGWVIIVGISEVDSVGIVTIGEAV